MQQSFSYSKLYNIPSEQPIRCEGFTQYKLYIVLIR